MNEWGNKRQLIHVNASDRLDSICYYDRECLEIVNELYKKDFEEFGYDKILKCSE